MHAELLPDLFIAFQQITSLQRAAFYPILQRWRRVLRKPGGILGLTKVVAAAEISGTVNVTSQVEPTFTFTHMACVVE